MHSLGPPYCSDCVDNTADDEEEDDRPTVIAPGFGGFARLNTDESIEQAPVPTPRPPTPVHPNARDTLDLAPASAERPYGPLALVLLATILTVAASLFLLS